MCSAPDKNKTLHLHHSVWKEETKQKTRKSEPDTGLSDFQDGGRTDETGYCLTGSQVVGRQTSNTVLSAWSAEASFSMVGWRQQSDGTYMGIPKTATGHANILAWQGAVEMEYFSEMVPR